MRGTGRANFSLLQQSSSARVRLPDIPMGQNMEVKGWCLGVFGGNSLRALRSQANREGRPGFADVAQKIWKAELGFDAGTLGCWTSRRHRLRSNPPVRLTPRADAGSCSSLQFSYAQGAPGHEPGRCVKYARG